MTASTTVARLACDETTARRLAAYLGETLDTDDAACAAFEEGDKSWHVAIHFRTPPDEPRLRQLVEFAAGKAAANALSIQSVAAADWVGQSLARLKPVRVGRFLIHGAHDRARLKANDIGIEIEAALAFGTGHHGTTRGCLVALADLAKRRRSRRVLDVGTGTGVLAIASARLSRTQIVGSDIDPVAVRAASANAHLNRAAAWIKFVRAKGTIGTVITDAAPYDLIFANILLGPLARLAVKLSELAAPGAQVVLSGLLPEHANAALAIYRAQGLALERRIQIEGWTTLVLRRMRPRGRLRPEHGLRANQNRPGRG